MNKSKLNILVWQWNCRGLGKKRHNLQMHISTHDPCPTVIALQEPGLKVKLTGYQTIQSPNNPFTATLVHRNVSVESTPIEGTDIPHDFVILYPPARQALRLYVLNVYSSPKAIAHNFNSLFTHAIRAAQHHPLLILGDFNAPHLAWGYHRTSPKGRRLWDLVQTKRLTIESDPTTPTRMGNSVQRDTMPDLSLSRNIHCLRWHSTPHSLGSDHFIIALDLQPIHSLASKPRQQYLTNWHQFRTESEQISPPTSIDASSLTTWIAELLTAKRSQDRPLEPEIPSDVVDTRLHHLWEAYRSIERRWRAGKHRRRLRARLAQLQKTIEAHALELARLQWAQLCDQMRGNLGMRRTWHLLRHLLDPSSSRTQTQSRLTQLVHKYPGTNTQLLDYLQATYIAQGPTFIAPHYSGPPQPELDREITQAEVRAALLQIRTNTAPGPDGITNKLLRNLDDTSIATLTKFYNHFWIAGTLPPEWKHAKISFIPKPGKPLALENLRPISLTSCVGKVLEHIIHARLTQYLDDSNAYPPTMLGFRSRLSVQDVHLQLLHDIITPPSRMDTAAILALDLQKAFDQVSHAAILSNLETLKVGHRTYNYIRSFLTNRTAELHLGDVASAPIKMSSIGTPQGAVLSPLLFNIALLQLPQQLSQIPDLRHSLYADDITLWTSGGSDAQIEETLQAGANMVLAAATQAGLTCSTAKSELLILPPPRGKPPSPPTITITLGQSKIPTVPRIKVLGLSIQQNRSNSQYLSQLNAQITQTIGLLRRIAPRHHGLKEAERLRFIQAFIISRLTFSVPYLNPTRAELDKVNRLLRKVYRVALQVPHSTSTARLEQLGIHNTAEELIEAHLMNQYSRLASSPAGLEILRRLHIRVPIFTNSVHSIPPTIRDNILTRPLPRNMHPTHHVARREQRARYLAEKYPIKPTTHYVDAASYRNHPAYALAVINSPNSPPLTSLTIRTHLPTEAEEAAIALALSQSPTPKVIVSDSQSAIRNFARGRISAKALKILLRDPPKTPVELVWTPAHTGLGGNEAAHTAARDLTVRAGPSVTPNHGAQSTRDSLITYAAITAHYRLLRQKYPPAHSSLSTKEERLWRLLQTNTLPCRAHLYRIYPDQYPSPLCPHCGDVDTICHAMWACPRNPLPLIPSVDQWEAALGGSDPGVQKTLVERAAEVTAGLRPVVTTRP